MKILLSNDDGFGALGIQTLAKVLRAAQHDVFIVAPNEEKSGNSHAMSFFNPIMVKEVGHQEYSVYGSPADSVAVALGDILKNNKPDLVISGINNGYNVGRDVNYSGTVGAATEAALEGYKSIAVSMDYVTPRNLEIIAPAFVRVAEFVRDLLTNIASINWPKDEVLNINCPAVPAKGARIAECTSASLYDFALSNINPSSSVNNKLRIYLLGGNMIDGANRKISELNTTDVSLVCKGYISMSFLQCRQSSTINSNLLQPFLPQLEKNILGE